MIFFGDGHAMSGGLIDVIVGKNAHLVWNGTERLQGAARGCRLLHALEAAAGALHVRRTRHGEVERGIAAVQRWKG